MAADQTAWLIPTESDHGDQLVHLQRLYRICEGDRRAYCSNTKATLLKQRKIIEKLESEKAELRHALDKLDDYKEHVVDDRLINSLAKSYQSQKLVLVERREVVDGQKDEIHRLEDKIARARSALQATHSRGNLDHDSKRVPNLEDRLENAFVHLNRLLHRNGNLRRYIEHLVQQRNMHKFICKQLTETMAGYKAKIEEAMVSANETYNKRDDAYQRMQALKSTRDHEHQVCGALLQEARRNVEQHRGFVEFVATKHRKRPRRAGSGSLRRDDGGTGEDGSEDRQKQQQLLHWDKVTANFELFTYCSNLSNKMKSLQKGNKALKELLASSSQAETENERMQEEAIRKTQADLTEVEEALQEAEVKLTGVMTVLRKLKLGIENMLHLVGSDGPVSRREDVEDEEEVSEAALKTVLREIEDQVNVLLQTRRFMDISERQMKEQERSLSTPKTPSGSLTKAVFFHPERDGIADMDIPSLPIIPSL